MPLFRRSDGEPIARLSPVRRIMPALMRSRNESSVYYEQCLDLTRTLPFVEQWNRDHSVPLTVFDIIVAGCGHALYARPGLNRFVSGGRIYQRREVVVAFAAKKSFSDDAPLVTVKLPLVEREKLEDTLWRIHERLGAARGDAERGVDKEVRWLTRLPPRVLQGVVRLTEWADGWNVLPRVLRDGDPMYSSIFLANLGSVGLDGAFHHLYEHGTTSLFGVVGSVKKQLVSTADGTPRCFDGVSLRWTFDERIHDGFYCAASLELLRDFVENPAQHVGVGRSAMPRPQPAAMVQGE